MNTSVIRRQVIWTCAMLVGFAVVAPPIAQGAALILNEWNAVGGSDFLSGGSSDSYFGRVQGNGDNWIELVVTEDHVDMRGWELRWWEDDGDGDGTAIWDPTRVNEAQSQGLIKFSDASLWSDLRAGSIITIADQQFLDTEFEGGAPASFDLSSDTSYNPLGGDFTIHISSRGEVGGASPLVTTLSNVEGDPAGAFSVGNSDWELRVFDGLMDHFGPIGEAWGDFGGISDEEVGKLEADPSPFSTLDDYNDGSSSTFGAPNIWSSGAETQDFSALRAQVPEPGTLLLALGGVVVLFRRRP